MNLLSVSKKYLAKTSYFVPVSGQNVRGQNVRGQNVLAKTSVAKTFVAKTSWPKRPWSKRPSTRVNSIHYCRLLKIYKLLPLYQPSPYQSVAMRTRETEGRWFDPRLGQYSFRGLMIVIATGFISLSPLFNVSTMVMLENSQWLGKNIVRSTG